jgi:hypothetical protein
MSNGKSNQLKRLAIAAVCVGMVGSGGLVQAKVSGGPVKPVVKSLKTGKITPVMTQMIRVPASNIKSLPLGQFDEITPVNLPNFEIGKAEVTGALWSEVYNWAIRNGYTFANKGDNVGTDKPVTKISWYDAIVFANAYSERSGFKPVYRSGINEVLKDATQGEAFKQATAAKRNGYRLLTQTQWELAARFLGTTKPTKGTLATEAKRTMGRNGETTYYWTPNNYASGAVYNANNQTETASVAWFGLSNGTKRACTKSLNALKICDMSGNVEEWVVKDAGRGSLLEKNDVALAMGGGLTVSSVGSKVASRPDSFIGFRLARNML